MDEERRSDKRVGVNLPTRWRGIMGTHEGRVEDVSANGCFVNTKGAADIGEIVSLLINFRPASGCRCVGRSFPPNSWSGLAYRFPFSTRQSNSLCANSLSFTPE